MQLAWEWGQMHSEFCTRPVWLLRCRWAQIELILFRLKSRGRLLQTL